ncbi:serine/threonine protein kinase [Streptomyces sp. VNUA24]|uniref:serine/threonine-protein kinase n=1 Tax=Streptomyces sp. VNUA24 TaxID=3031131 RepID=UPI0023B78C7F|nr:serine/threonine protein kinase [Streptomyces sp. VNUA24]WEH17926.1 protein kinase [Streptomyces sp. VNUA24]
MRDFLFLLVHDGQLVKGVRGMPEIAWGGVPGLVVAGRYRLVAGIGQGGMGRVWRATDDMLDRQVAVKEMRIDGLDPEDSRTRRERTLREARATARIDHPHVVRVYDVVDAGDRLWIVMELVDGRSLEQVVAQDGPLGVRDTARIGLELVDALGQVHAQGVLHRDIKPANVLVKRTGAHHAVLTDFGIAAIQNAEALTMAGMLVGSPDYMAPERVSGRPQGPPSDLWSLGATLCAALGGRSPFSRATTLATLHAVLYEEPELPPAAGPLHDVLAALLAKQPESRPGVPELTETLRRLATSPAPATRTTEPRPPGAQEPAGTAGAAPGPAAPGLAEPATRSAVGATSPATGAGDTVTGPGGEGDPGGTPEDGIAAPEGPAPTASEPVPVPVAGRPSARRPELASAGPTPLSAEARPSPAPTPDAEAPPPPAGPPTPTHPTPTIRNRPTPLTDRPTTPVLHRTPVPTPPTSSAPPPTSTPELPPTTAPAPPDGAELPTRPRPAPPAVSPPPRRDHRRAGLLAVTALAVTAAVAAVVVPAMNGASDDENDNNGKSGGTSTSASPSPKTPTRTPDPTVAGTSRPPELPPGARTEAGVFAWVPPEGFSREVHAGAEVHYTSPDARQEIVGKASLARGDLLEQWRKKERSTAEGPGYERIRLEETEFRGRPAVVWEYTVIAQELPWHVRSLGFDTGGKSYQLTTWYHPDIGDRALPVYEKVEKTFTPL